MKDLRSDIPAPVQSWIGDKEFTTAQQLSHTPWSTVWRLKRADGSGAILKVIHHVNGRDLSFLASLGTAFPDTCPKVQKADPKNGLFLFEDVGDQPAASAQAPSFETNKTLLAQYGTIQATLAQPPASKGTLPVLNPLQILGQVQEMLENPNQETWPGNGFAHIPAEQRDVIRKDLIENEVMLTDWAHQIRQAPATINHTDLREANVILRDDGGCWIIDWDDAASSAPGWSLHMPFSGVTRLHAVLHQPDLYRNAEGREIDMIAMETYLNTLTSTGIYDRAELRDLLPRAATFGIMKYATDMAAYPLANDHVVQAVARTIQSRFDSLHTYLRLLKKPDTIKKRAMTDRIAFPEVTFNEPAAPGETAKTAADLLKAEGAVMLRNCFPQEVITNAKREFAANVEKFKTDMKSGKALKVGNRRYMISLSTRGVFGSPDLLAAPALMEVLSSALS